MSDINSIAKQFTDFYYQTFAADRSQLGPLYRDHSMLTWENTPIQGAPAIIEKLKSLPFEKVQHRVLTLDAQPASASVAAILVLVTGQLLVDDGQNVLQYSQMFHLIPDGGSYFVQNDVFRLVYG
ncbi:Nuclear transport factor 2 [Cryptotrichosporon argae]